jgi:ABC-type transport system substrate-binding protein
LRFTCLLIDNLALWERMALLVQKQLFDVGVDMQLESLPAEVFNKRVVQGDFDAVFLESIGGTSISKPFSFWYSQSPVNYFHYHNGATDEALDAIRGAPDDQTYRIAVRRLQQSMIADPPAIFLAWGQTARAVSRRFQVPNTPGSDILASVGSWQPVSIAAQITN